MIRLYADFNRCDDQGRVVLNTVGSLADIERHTKELSEGMVVLLYQDDELEAEGTLIFDQVWMAIPKAETFNVPS